MRIRKPRTEKEKSRQRELLAKSRSLVLDILGNKCIQCGFSDKRALQIDHINGGGTEKRLKGIDVGIPYHKRVIDSFLNGDNEYQLLCANCNWIKAIENREIRNN